MNKEPIELAKYREGRKAESKPSGSAIRACLPGEVPCGRCQQPVSARAQRCPNCKVHFSGFAADFAPSKPRPLVYKVAGVALIAATLLAALGLLS
jgi:hypothetical protein